MESEVGRLHQVLASMGAADYSVGLRKRARAELKLSKERLESAVPDNHNYEIMAVVACCYVAMMALVYIASDFYPWPFDPPSIHRVKPQQFGGVK